MEIKRIFDLLGRFKALPDTVGRFKLAGVENGKWREYDTSEYNDSVWNVSMGLLAMGMKPGEKIATITNNRPEWNFMEMGIAMAGMVHVPVHPTLSEEEFTYILNHSESSLVIVSDTSLYKKIKSISEKLVFTKKILTFNKVEDAENWTVITDAGKKQAITYYDEVMRIRENITENDLLTIIYTSGTTGLPKGVMLSHKNLLSNAIASAQVQHLNHNHKALSFLPLSHVFEHMVNYMYHYLGISIYYAESINTIARDIKDLQVDGFIAVPRLLESIYDKIIQKARKLSPVKRYIFLQSLKLAESFTPYKKHSLSFRIRHYLADKLVFSKWRDALSKNITFIGCGGSALQPRLARIFWAAGLPVYEGYGLTETSPVVAVNYSQPGFVMPGTVGKILKDVEVKIADDGEILIKSPGLMMGYYKDPEGTADVIDKDGWFHSGDIGEFAPEGFLKITDRKKEIFKMSNGKYVAPQQIENKLKESFYIQQLMVVGENQKYPAAIISPNFQELALWCRKKKIQFQDNTELIKNSQVIKHFQEEIRKFNKKLGENDQVKKIILIADEWSPITGELSSSLKLKRQFIIQKYKDLVEAIYNSKAEPIPVENSDKENNKF
ncbi:MAG: long-chain fatty acid--CoA ligase [Bacteroidetes bacterium]|nr:MAG: long-chain fatty acid--CoA ligase [Bacteroidota bacterium]